jgi:hypothetical protein
MRDFLDRARRYKDPHPDQSSFAIAVLTLFRNRAENAPALPSLCLHPVHRLP